MAGALALLSPEQVEQLTAEAAARQSLPSQLALQKGLLSVTQIDIVETLLRPTEAIPGYEILGVLGQGGMGVVYRARQLNLKRVVALKTVLVTEMGDESALERFEQEAQAVARLAHPHITAAFDFGRHEGRLYFAMELVEGEDVHRLIARRSPLDERTVWSLVRQAAAGLAHAAQQGIVHRDIKPANLLLVEPPAGFPLPPGIPLLKIADFGLARLAAAADETRLTSVGTTVGSPHYMPPEQLRGEPVDQRADIFALGASAFHMLAGKPPLAGKTMPQIIAFRLGDQTESLQAVRPEVTRKSAELVAAMMAPDPLRRIADYGELARRIDALVHPVVPAALDSATAPYLPVTGAPQTTPITTEPTQPMVASRRWSSLNRLILAIVGLAVVLVILGTFGRRNSTGERDLVESGRVEQLFNGRNINGWQTVSGGWNPAKNDEGAVVLQGRGAIRRPLLAHGAAGEELQPLEHYRLTFVVDLHEATAVELQFDLSDSGSGSKCRVVRIDRERSALGRRDGRQGSPRIDASLAQSAESDGGLHAIQLERQSHGWWIFVDERFLGSAPFDTAMPAAEFGLLAEGGPAWFSDFTVEELVPAAKSETR
ncbi:MAG TPA: serine/threonine-protein kinase [Pirellulales bacterium]